MVRHTVQLHVHAQYKQQIHVHMPKGFTQTMCENGLLRVEVPGEVQGGECIGVASGWYGSIIEEGSFLLTSNLLGLLLTPPHERVRQTPPHHMSGCVRHLNDFRLRAHTCNACVHEVCVNITHVSVCKHMHAFVHIHACDTQIYMYVTHEYICMYCT
jgi:hypothetical protein